MFLFLTALSERLFPPQKSCPLVLPSNLYIVCSVPPVHNLNVPGSAESLAYKDKWAPDKYPYPENNCNESVVLFLEIKLPCN